MLMLLLLLFFILFEGGGFEVGTAPAVYAIAQRRQIREASDKNMFDKTKAKFSAPDLRTDALITNET